ncbi:MAG: hypothetical protein AAGB29_10760 [Planctomycetota bacterium]
MRVVRSPLGRYQLQVGLASLDLGPGELKKLHRLLKTAVDDYADALAADACGANTAIRHLPPDLGDRSSEPPADPEPDHDQPES